MAATMESEWWIPEFTMGHRLRIAREGAGITTHEMGEKLGVTPQAITTWENGSRVPRKLMEVIRVWSELTKVPDYWLYTGRTVTSRYTDDAAQSPFLSSIDGGKKSQTRQPHQLPLVGALS